MANGLLLADMVAHDFDVGPSGYATLDREYGRETLDFPQDADLAAISRPRWMPYGYGGGLITIRLCWMRSDGANSDVGCEVTVERYEENTTDLAGTSFGDIAAASDSASAANTPQYTDVALNTAAKRDDVDAGDMFRIKVVRKGTTDDLDAPARLLGVMLFEGSPP